MNKERNLLLILFVIGLAAVLIIIYNKKKQQVVLKTTSDTPDFETISYRLPTDVDPTVFGPKYWEAYHNLTSNIPCGTCKEFAVRFMIFFHDVVNLKLGKPLYDPKNFAEISQLITTINLKGNRWPE